jgi:hypothetical protein
MISSRRSERIVRTTMIMATTKTRSCGLSTSRVSITSKALLIFSLLRRGCPRCWLAGLAGAGGWLAGVVLVRACINSNHKHNPFPSRQQAPAPSASHWHRQPEHASRLAWAAAWVPVRSHGESSPFAIVDYAYPRILCSAISYRRLAGRCNLLWPQNFDRKSSRRRCFFRLSSSTRER